MHPSFSHRNSKPYAYLDEPDAVRRVDHKVEPEKLEPPWTIIRSQVGPHALHRAIHLSKVQANGSGLSLYSAGRDCLIAFRVNQNISWGRWCGVEAKGSGLKG